MSDNVGQLILSQLRNFDKCHCRFFFLSDNENLIIHRVESRHDVFVCSDDQQIPV